jgi:peptidoglycan hydrolase-like protein with peptidoglycan-binding domain
MKDAAEAGQYIRRGQRGESVQRLQEMLRQRGYDVGEPDGRLGPNTERAIRQFQRDQGIGVDGVVGPETLGALGVISNPARSRRARQSIGSDTSVRAPREGEAAPDGSVRAGTLAQADESARARRVATSTPAAGPDGRLAQIQQRAVASAGRELDAGVREHAGPNRGDRVDQYAREAGMPAGGEWCGYFTGHNYIQAGRETGTTFTGQHRLHSYQKARSYFLYRNYTNASRSEVNRNEALRAEHGAQGSQRRYMTFEGSVGDRYASRRDLPHEAYSDHRQLPIRAGDTALFAHGHVGMVESYDAASGRLTTIEGNVGNRVQRKTYDLSDPAVRARFDGFGRPAAGDFQPAD